MGPQDQQDDSWPTPSTEEIAAKAAHLLGQEGEEEPEETPEEPAEKPGKETPPEGEPETPAKDTGKAARPGEEEPSGRPEDRVYEIDGERYTADEIREWKQGALRQDDYTRKTQALSEDRKTLERLLDQNQKLMERLTQSGKPDPDEDGDEKQPIDPRIARELKENRELLAKINEDREKEQVERQQREIDDFIIENYKTSLNRLFEEFKVDPKFRHLYDRAIRGINPETADPASGLPTEASVARAVRREFLKLHHQAQEGVQTTVRGKIDALKARPKPPVETKGKTTTPAKPGGDLVDKNLQKKWNTDENTRQFLERLHEVSSPTD